MAAEAPELVDDAVEEVLVRCPPDDPARLLCAALVCKRWSRVVSEPGFRRRYVARHRAAPALGFLCNLDDDATHFVPAASPSPSSFRPRRAVHLKMRALDARHGRVLLLRSWPWGVLRLVVWDPITDNHRELPLPPVAVHQTRWNAAVLCDADGCDHLDCHRGAFRVVVVGYHPEQERMYSCLYSSDRGGGCGWSTRTASFPHPDCRFKLKPSALAGNALHFVLMSRTLTVARTRILKYDLATKEMTMIPLPHTEIGYGWPDTVLTTMEDGGLGFAMVNSSNNLYLWSWVDGDGQAAGRDARWCPSRVVDLKTLLPSNASPGAVGFAGGVGIIFLSTKVGNFVIDLKSNRATKLAENRRFFNTVFPFTSFCIPALGAASAGEGRQAGA